MIIVTGGTGVIGRHVVRELAHVQAAFRLMVRNPEKIPESRDQEEMCRGDLDDPSSLAEAFQGGTSLFLLSPHGPRMADQQMAAIDAAQQAGISHIVKVSGSPQAVGPDCFSATGRQHFAVERALEGSGISYTVLRPSFFMQNFLGKPAAFVRQGKPIMMPFGRDQKFTFVDARDIAKAAAKSLLRPGGESKVVHLVGDRKSFLEVAAILSVLLDREVLYRKTPLWLMSLVLRLQGEPAWIRHHQIEMARVFAAYGDMEMTDDLRLCIEKEPVSLTTFFTDHLDAFGGVGV